MDDKPNQPGNFKFPKHSFGQKNPELRAFNPQWFSRGCINRLMKNLGTHYTVSAYYI